MLRMPEAQLPSATLSDRLDLNCCSSFRVHESRFAPPKSRKLDSERRTPSPAGIEPLEPRLLLSAAPDPVWISFIDDPIADVAADADGNSHVAGQGLNGFAFVSRVNSQGVEEWTTYFGGGGLDWASRIAIDGAGNIVVTGQTSSAFFDGATNTFHANEDAFVAKLSPTGQLLWSTYIGGAGFDAGHGVAVDADNHILVTGQTDSPDLSAANNTLSAGADAFAARLDPNGALLWSTYIGGDRFDSGNSIAIDADGFALITGTTGSTDLAGGNNAPISPIPFNDVFVARVSPTGSLVWSTYLGGVDFDTGLAIAADAEGNSYVTGWTESPGFEQAENPYHGGIADAFLAKVSSDGQQLWALHIGGRSQDTALALALDQAGNILLTGSTFSSDLSGAVNSPTSIDRDGFLAQVSPDGTLLWTAYVGGNGNDLFRGITVHPAGDVLLVGQTSSTDFGNPPSDMVWSFIARMNLQTLIPPGDVSDVSAAAGDQQVLLEWTNPPDADLDGVLILRRADSPPDEAPERGVEYDVGDSLGGGIVVHVSDGTGFLDTGLVNGTTYHYTLHAFDTARNYADGQSVSATPQPAPLVPPEAPTGLQASTTLTDRVHLQWNAVENATSYEVWRHTADDVTQATRIADGLTETTYDDATAEPGTTYRYWVRAVNQAGPSPFSQAATGIRALVETVPAAPTGVQASSDLTDRIRVSWNAVGNAAEYELWRHTTDQLEAANMIADGITANVFDDLTAEPGVPYFYWVRAANAAGVSGFSVAAAGLRAQVQIPAAPMNLQASTDLSDRVQLTWDAVEGAASYEVWRHTSQQAGEATLLAADLTQTSFADTTAAPDTTYFYWVRARNEAGASDFSAAAEGQRVQVPPPPIETVDLVLGVGGVRSIRFTDASGSLVTLGMRRGTAVVRIAGVDLAPQEARRGVVVGGSQQSIAEITLTDTHARSTLTIDVRGGDGRTTVGRVVGDTPLGHFNAPAAVLAGDGIVMSGEGIIGRTNLAVVLSGAQIIMPGEAFARGVRLGTETIEQDVRVEMGSPLERLRVLGTMEGMITAPWAGRVNILDSLDGRIDLTGQARRGVSLGRLNASSMQGGQVQADGGIGRVRAGAFDGSFAAEWIERMAVAGDLTGSIDLTGTNVRHSLGRLNVTGLISDATITAARHIGAVAAGGMRGSSIFAGAQTIDQALPDSRAAFDEAAQARIGRITSGQQGFSDTRIAAWEIGRATVGGVEADNDGVEFGFAAVRIGVFTDRDAGVQLRNLSDPGVPVQRDDFVVRIV